MKSTTKKIISVFVLMSVVTLLMAVPVSAGEFTRLMLLNDLLSRSSDYDIVWEGEYKGGIARVAFNGGKSSSALSGLNIDANSVDVLSYERNNIRSYGSGSSNYGRYSGNGFNRGSSFGSGNSYRDTSERLFIDNRENNAGRNEVARTGLIVAGDVVNTNTLAQRDVRITDSLAQRDVRLAELLTQRDIRTTTILAEHDLEKTKVIVNSHPRWDADKGYYNWRY
jgi:hypothetical protein